MKQIALDIGLTRGPDLDNYCPGPNEAALAHLKLWCAGPMRSPVPTYLWGESGSGKTHLLKAVAQSLRDQGMPVGWMDAAQAEPAGYDERWAAVLLDDTHLYTPVQQHAAFNWFVNAHAHQRAVLAGGALPPADLKLREDLRTRLGWGHVFQLHALSEPQRRAVLREAADSRGIVLSDDVVNWMLNRFSRDLGSLMQLLDYLDKYALETQRAITIPLIRSMLENE